MSGWTMDFYRSFSKKISIEYLIYQFVISHYSSLGFSGAEGRMKTGFARKLHHCAPSLRPSKPDFQLENRERSTKRPLRWFERKTS